METNDGRIETISIIPIVDGISCTIQVLLNGFDQNINRQLQAISDIDGLLNELMDYNCDTYIDFKTVKFDVSNHFICYQ